MTTGASGIAAAFDGITSSVFNSSAATAGGAGYAGKDWGIGVSKTVVQVNTYGSSDDGYDGSVGATSITLEIKGSNDGVTWTTLGSRIFADATATNQQIFVSTDLITTTAYRYHGVFVTPSGPDQAVLAEVEFFEPTPVPDMTLQSVANTALAQPDNVFAVLRQQDVDAVAPNTDLTVEASRDGGTTWTAITLAKAATLGADRILTGSAVISAQPVGTSMKWRVKTLNAKSQKIHAVGLEWS